MSFKYNTKYNSIDEVHVVTALDYLGIKSAEINGELSTLDGSPLPSQDQIEAARQAVYDLYLSTNYQRERRVEYPEIGIQLDMLYHDIKSGNLSDGSWIQAIESIKDKYPKT